MKQRRKKAKRKSKKPNTQSNNMPANTANPIRRDFMKYLRVGGIGDLYAQFRQFGGGLFIQFQTQCIRIDHNKTIASIGCIDSDFAKRWNV